MFTSFSNFLPLRSGFFLRSQPLKQSYGADWKSATRFESHCHPSLLVGIVSLQGNKPSARIDYYGEFCLSFNCNALF